MAEITAALRGNDLTLTDFEVIRLTPSMDADSYLPVLEYAGTLGARNVMLTATSAGVTGPNAEAGLARALEKLGDHATRFGIRPMLEFMAYRDVASLAQATRIVRLVGSDRVGICIDALHLNRSGGTTADVVATDPALIAAGPATRCVARWATARGSRRGGAV